MKELLSTIDGYILEAREIIMVAGAFVFCLGLYDLWAIHAGKTVNVDHAWAHLAACLGLGSFVLYRGAMLEDADS